MSEIQSAQDHFDAVYITGSEIQSILKVQRCTVTTANKKGLLPDPIIIRGAGTFIWERKKVMSYIEAWRIVLDERRRTRKGKTE